MVEIFINDKKFKVAKNTKLLDTCKKNNIYIPTLCYHPDFPGFAGCRLCVVEVRKKNESKLVAACEYPIRSIERFYTESEMVKKSRRMTAKLLIARAPEAKEILEEIINEKIEPEFDTLNVQNKRCVLCGLCYRLCHKQGTAAIYTAGRGADKVVQTPYKDANEDCIGCGSCVAICPTGAIRMIDSNGKRALWYHQFELLKCPICGEQHITNQMLLYEMQKTGLSETELSICPRCRREKMGQEMLRGICHEKIVTVK
ncbi:MAG: (2Fe-2S)-binding protein [Desulfobacterales bacterium]|nr:(2Fe-2S)-binding protein [Desulfobacterales bacterium]